VPPGRGTQIGHVGYSMPTMLPGQDGRASKIPAARDGRGCVAVERAWPAARCVGLFWLTFELLRHPRTPMQPW
jgi:hypothetical protein